jgi:hypothetical protein
LRLGAKIDDAGYRRSAADLFEMKSGGFGVQAVFGGIEGSLTAHTHRTAEERCCRFRDLDDALAQR